MEIGKWIQLIQKQSYDSLHSLIWNKCQNVKHLHEIYHQWEPKNKKDSVDLVVIKFIETSRI